MVTATNLATLRNKMNAPVTYLKNQSLNFLSQTSTLNFWNLCSRFNTGTRFKHSVWSHSHYHLHVC